MLSDERSRQAATLAARRILITGAAGFIGSHMCARLVALGAEVHAASRTFATDTASPADGAANLSQVAADLSDPAATRRLVASVKPDIIIHLAGHAAAARDAALVLPTFASNLASTVNVLTAALEAGSPRVVLPASLEEPTDPDAIASSPYAISKWGASAYARMFHGLYSLPVAIGRTFITYGPTTKDLHKLIPYVVLSLLDNAPPRLASGTREVDWIYVDDVVDGLLALATAPGAVGQTLDIGSGSLVSVRAIVERIAALIGSPAEPVFGALPDRTAEQVRVADIARSRAVCGWEPRVTLDDGLRRTVDWFRAHREELRAQRAPI